MLGTSGHQKSHNMSLSLGPLILIDNYSKVKLKRAFEMLCNKVNNQTRGKFTSLGHFEEMSTDSVLFSFS